CAELPRSLHRQRRGDSQMTKKKPEPEELPSPPTTIPSYELPRKNPGQRWQRRRVDEEMEEKSAQGFDTPMNRRQFLDVVKKVGAGVAATSWLYPAFLAACGKTADSLTPSTGGKFNVG